MSAPAQTHAGIPRRSNSSGLTSYLSLGTSLLELIPNPQTEQLTFAQAGLGSLKLVVPLENDVIHRLVGQPEGSDSPRQGFVPHHSGGHIGLSVEILIAEEGVQPLGGGGSQ